MITRTFVDKCTTIYRDSEDNYGLYPVGMLCYGGNVSRSLLYFDLSKLEKEIAEGIYDKTKLKHILYLKNCGNVDKRNSKRILCKGNSNEVTRATSFDIIVFRIPREWDEGVGFDCTDDYWIYGKRHISQNGCNWFQSTNGNMWSNTIGCDEGIFSTSTLSKEYTKFAEGFGDLVVARQHFEYGNENFEIDVTKFVNNVLDKKYKNNGLGLAFSPMLEETDTPETFYVGYFTNNTNTIFHPYIESRCDDAIKDDRYSFYLNKTNRIYLYASINGELVNLDETPICTVEGINEELEVKKQTKGVYYTELKLTKETAEPDTIMYDTWSNLYYKGDAIDDVEMEFVTLKPRIYFGLGENVQTKRALVATTYGINDSEKINQGDKRMVKVIFKVPYNHTDYEIVDDAKYRIYVKDGSSEIDIIKWDSIERANKHNFFYVKTAELLPAEYHVDIMLPYGNETRVFKDELKFKVVNNKSGQKM